MKAEGLYSESGTITKRGLASANGMREYFKKAMLKAKTPREVHDLERIIQHELLVVACFRKMDLMTKKRK